jgi:hypothetical protein
MGNEEQYKHNKTMFVKMREARNQIETNTVSPENISEARKKIVEVFLNLNVSVIFSSIFASWDSDKTFGFS